MGLKLLVDVSSCEETVLNTDKRLNENRGGDKCFARTR